MTPKEKAKNIYNQMLEWADDAHIYKERNIICITSKQSALICIDEMIKERQILNNDFDRDRIIELKEVKQEINKL
tara:strand:- start:65 stop:289 length:225 start_codon:yes stop_codon:yes gene_type:complete